MTLTYITTRSNLVTLAFLFIKVRKWIILKLLQPGRAFLDLDPSSFIDEGLTFFLRNHWHIFNQILNVYLLVKVNENSSAICRSHDQDSCHALYGKPLLKYSFQEPLSRF